MTSESPSSDSPSLFCNKLSGSRSWYGPCALREVGSSEVGEQRGGGAGENQVYVTDLR